MNLKFPHLQEDLNDLVEAREWEAVKDFFSLCENGEDERVDKVLLWGHFFLPHYFRNASPEFHRELIKDFFSEQNEYTCAPRGFSKTTIIQTCIMFSCVNQLDKFIVVVEKTFTEASEVISGVHSEFVDNETLLIVYGSLLKVDEEKQKRRQYEKRITTKEKDAQGDVFINGVRIRGKGFNSSVRGLKTREWRPTTIVLDDVEEDEHINNPEQRQKYTNNYNKGIQPAVDIDGRIKVFGTILHQDSLLKRLVDTHGGKIFKAHEGSDPATAPIESFLWIERWSRERLVKKRNDMMSEGKSTNAYAQEYLNDPISEEERTFKFEWLWEMVPDPNGGKYRVPAKRISMQEFEKLRLKTTFNVYAMLDCADSTTVNADWTGVIVVAVDPNNNRYRLDVRREKRNVNGVISLIFEVWKKWVPYGLVTIGIEKKAFNDQIVPLFEQKKDELQEYPVIEELKPMGRNKENRIKGALQGLYESGKIYSVYNEINGIIKPVGHTDQLLEELYDHPSAKHDDLSDAEAYGADIVVIPLNNENKTQPHHDPIDDPFKDDFNPVQQQGGSTIGNFDDPSDVFE